MASASRKCSAAQPRANQGTHSLTHPETCSKRRISTCSQLQTPTYKPTKTPYQPLPSPKPSPSLSRNTVSDFPNSFTSFLHLFQVLTPSSHPKQFHCRILIDGRVSIHRRYIMCNGTSNRVSQGGSIAVLRPTRHLRRSPSNTDDVDMTLFFQNRFSASGTSVELQGWTSSTQNEDGNERHWVVIQ